MGKDVLLHVSATNTAMLLYQKFGFKAQELILNFYYKYFPFDCKDSTHAFLMRLRRWPWRIVVILMRVDSVSWSWMYFYFLLAMLFYWFLICIMLMKIKEQLLYDDLRFLYSCYVCHIYTFVFWAVQYADVYTKLQSYSVDAIVVLSPKSCLFFTENN